MVGRVQSGVQPLLASSECSLAGYSMHSYTASAGACLPLRDESRYLHPQEFKFLLICKGYRRFLLKWRFPSRHRELSDGRIEGQGYSTLDSAQLERSWGRAVYFLKYIF